MTQPVKDIRGTVMALHQRGVRRERIVSLMPILIKPPTDVVSMVELLEKEVLVERDKETLRLFDRYATRDASEAMRDAIFLVNNKVPVGARSAQSQQQSTAPPALNTPTPSNLLPPAYQDVTPVGQSTTAPSSPPRHSASAPDPPKAGDVVLGLVGILYCFVLWKVFWWWRG
ncbi:hypothetical protein HK104_005376 [Borealophlyctis nickersoniae]|nr:hypothetical protein HK104_005376 [Borealophlyctis nickersoniae]